MREELENLSCPICVWADRFPRKRRSSAVAAFERARGDKKVMSTALFFRRSSRPGSAADRALDLIAQAKALLERR
jgi:hypothetical protein